MRQPECYAVSGNLPQVLAAAPQHRFLLPYPQNLGKFLINVIWFVKEMNSFAAKGAEGSSEHRLPEIAVIPPFSIEGLLRAVIDTGDAESGDIESQCIQHELPPAQIPCTKPFFPVSPADLVVIVNHRHYFVSEPDMGILL